MSGYRRWLLVTDFEWSERWMRLPDDDACPVLPHTKLFCEYIYKYGGGRAIGHSLWNGVKTVLFREHIPMQHASLPRSGSEKGAQTLYHFVDTIPSQDIHYTEIPVFYRVRQTYGTDDATTSMAMK